MNDERGGKPRVKAPQRSQRVIRFELPEEALAPTHPARVLWNVVGTLGLGAFLDGVKAVEGTVGRKTLSPRMKLVLWLYAISQAVGSAREIERLTGSDDAYRWIIGDLKVSREQAKLHLEAVLAAADDPEYTRAQHAARAAAARDYQERVAAAIVTVTELQKTRKLSDKPARASTTDAEARVMKMGDGGFRPGYNVQYAVAGSELGGPRTIVGVNVTNVGSDMGSLAPMVAQIEERTGERPAVLLADGGHAKAEDIATTRRLGVDVIVPPAETAKTIAKLKAEGVDPEVIAWRERMQDDDAKQLYRARAGLAELANAHQKTHHGITQVLVRGAAKITCVILLNAIASNLLRHAPKLLG